MIKLSKKKNKTKILLRLFNYILAQKKLFVLVLILSLFANVFSLIGPFLSGEAIDAIELGEGKVDFSAVWSNVILMIAFYVISGILTYVLSVMMINLSQKIVFKMRKDVFENLSKLPVKFFDKIQAGELISIISYDIDTVNASLSADLMHIVAGIITIIGSLISMILISPQMLIVFVITVPVSLWIAVRRTKVVRPLFKSRSKSFAQLNGYIEETVSGAKTIKAYNVEKEMLEKFDEKNDRAVDAFYQADYAAVILGPTMNFINNFSLALISVLGVIFFLMGNITIGGVSAFILYSRRFTAPINEIGNILSELASATSAADRVFSLIDENPEKEDKVGAEDIKDVKGEIEFKNVNFSYVENKPVIKNMNLHVKSGDTVAIVGKTGAGKSTIVNLLMRFYDVNEGSIFLDGKNIGDITRDSLRSAYTMVLQDTWLFEGTIFENIAYGKEGATINDVREAAKSVDIHDYIESLPQGYDSVLNDNAVNVSKGQKQLITIARAMLNDSKILILDEATSNVDTRTELKIQSAMEKLMEGKTCFIIAHRLSTIKHADVILVMENGELKEKGTHEKLMEKDGVYRKLYDAQFQ